MASPGMQQPTVRQLLAAVTTTATGNSASFTLPIAEAYAMYLVTTAATGTTPTLGAVLQTSLDNGTTWVNTGSAFASQTAAGSSGVVFKATMGVGQNASVISATPGTASAVNQPLNLKFMRLANTITGTTPSFTYSLYLICTPAGFSVV
jgi:hypothetical protein